MKDIKEYINSFTKLRRAHQYGGAPHKPILLLSIIDSIERGFIKSERIYITAELISLYRSNWDIWVKTPHSRNHDDTIGNGISLCPNLHRALDSGLITEVLDWHNNNVNLYANCQKISIFLSVF